MNLRSSIYFFKFRAFRFLIVGVVNTAFGFAVFSLAVFFNATTWQALLAGNLAGILFNFMTIGGIVFQNISPDRFLRFAAAYLGIFLINLKSIELITYELATNRIVAQAILTAPMAVLSYFVMSRLVFSKSGQ